MLRSVSCAVQAVEVEGVDMLVVSVSGEMAVSKEVEDLLKSAKTSIYIFRADAAQAPTNFITSTYT